MDSPLAEAQAPKQLCLAGQRGYHCAPVLDHLKDGKRYCDLLTASLAPLVRTHGWHAGSCCRPWQ